MSKVLNRDTYLSKNVGNFQDTIEINGKQADAELKNGKWYFKLTAGKYTIKA